MENDVFVTQLLNFHSHGYAISDYDFFRVETNEIVRFNKFTNVGSAFKSLSRGHLETI